MTRSHRRFHKLFWFVAAPLLILFYLLFQPTGSDSLMPAQDIPDGSSVAVFQVTSEAADKDQTQ